MGMDRRHFLKTALGLAATPLVTPKRSFFFFSQGYKPQLTLCNLQRAVLGATFGASKPSLLVFSKEQKRWMLTHKEIKDYHQESVNNWIDHFYFNGIPCISKDYPAEDAVALVRAHAVMHELRYPEQQVRRDWQILDIERLLDRS